MTGKEAGFAKIYTRREAEIPELATRRIYRKYMGRSSIKIWNIRKELSVLYFAFMDRQTPFYAKLPAILGLLYLISPVDIIPDFIPFVGYIDDLLIVPLLLNFSIRLLPGNISESSQIKASRSRKKLGYLFILFFFLVLAALTGLYIHFSR